VPEYVDDTCAVLAGADAYQPLVDGIKRLLHEPAQFTAMSAAAARRVRSGISNAHIIPRELDLIESGWNLHRNRDMA